MKTKAKTFDCVEMKRRAQEKIYEETKGMSAEELVAYFHQGVAQGPFGELWKKGTPGSRSQAVGGKENADSR